MHFTIVAFRGSDNAVAEANSLLRSLHRFSSRMTSCVLSNSKTMLNSIIGASIRQYVKTSFVMGIFEANNVSGFKHHSGMGGYAKMIVPLVLTSVDYTVVLDTDIVVNKDPIHFWNHLHNNGAVLQGKRLQGYECFGRDYRLNSGVLGMNLTAMRNSDWFHTMWKDINSLPTHAKCKHMFQNGRLMIGDQEFTSRVCELTKKCAYFSESKFHQDRCNGLATKTAVFIHNNCDGSKKTGVTGRLNLEFNRDILAIPLVVNASGVSRMRYHSMKQQLEVNRIPAVFNWAQPVRSRGEAKSQEIARNTIQALNTCAKSNFRLCIIMEDDAKLHPNFIDEASDTWNDLPPSARLLHMCPGFAWGRKYRNESLHFHANPEQHIGYPDVLSRYWKRWPCRTGFCATGGPVAFMVQADHIPLFLRSIKYPKDSELASRHLKSHYVAMEPQLCYEWSGIGYESSWLRHSREIL